MTPPRLHPDQIAAHQREADAFFRRPRSAADLRKLQDERFSPALRAAAAEAKTAHTWRDIQHAIDERHNAFQRAVASPLLDDVSRNLLRRTRGIRRQSAVQLERNQRAAERFFRRVDGRDLSEEITGYTRWARTQREKAALAVYRALMSGPVDPLTEEEARLVGTKTPQARWEAMQRAVRLSKDFRVQVRPAGMTLERALEIAMRSAMEESP